MLSFLPGCSWITSNSPKKSALQLEFVSSGNFVFPLKKSINSETLLAKIYNRLVNNSISELRILDLQMQVHDAINLSNEVVFLNYIINHDFDKDGEFEFIYSTAGENKVRFYKASFTNTGLNNALILEVPSPQPSPNPTAFYDFADINDDGIDDLILSCSINYPLPNDIRGIWAIDVINNKIFWYFPTAEFITGVKCGEDSLGNSLIITSSSGVDNGLSFVNGKFYKTTSNKVEAGKSHTNLFSHEIVKNSRNYSSFDSLAYLTMIDSSGDLIWRKEIGEKLVWTNLHKNETTNEIGLTVNHRKMGSKGKDYFSTFNLKNGDFTRKIEFSSKSLATLYLKDHLIQHNSGELIITNLNRNRTIISKHIPELVITDAYFTEDSKLRFVGRDETKVFVANEKLETIAKINIPDAFMSYLPGTDLFACFTPNSRIKFFRLVDIPIYEGLSSESMFSILIAILIVLVFITFLWGLTMNISRRKIIEQSEEIKRRREELESATAQLLLSEKLAVLGTISAGIAHELNGPIGAILNSSERIKNLYTDEENSILSKNNALIYNAAHRAKNIVSKFLLSSRSNPNEERRTKFSKVFLDWSELYNSQFSEDEINIELILETDKDLLITHSDLYQIISNIMFNSKDSLDTKNCTNKKITIISKACENTQQISFSDNGEGFDKQILDNPFRLFRTTKEVGKGSGLGLWIVYNILKNNDGCIKIGNSENGAFVTINLKY